MKLSERQRKEITSDFDDALNKVLINCMDPRTDHLAKRSITLKLTIKPKGDGKNFDLLPQISVREAPIVRHCDVQIGQNENGQFSLFSTEGDVLELPENYELFEEYK